MPFVEARIFHRTVAAWSQASSGAFLKARVGFLLLGKQCCHRVVYSKIYSRLCKVEDLVLGKALNLGLLVAGSWLSQVSCWMLWGLPSQCLHPGHLSTAHTQWSPDSILRIQVWVCPFWTSVSRLKKSGVLVLALLLAPKWAAQWAKLSLKGRGCPPLVVHLGHGTGKRKMWV